MRSIVVAAQASWGQVGTTYGVKGVSTQVNKLGIGLDLLIQETHRDTKESAIWLAQGDLQQQQWRYPAHIGNGPAQLLRDNGANIAQHHGLVLQGQRKSSSRVWSAAELDCRCSVN